MTEPIRTCIGCRRRVPSRELVRLRIDAEGMIHVGPGSGRGASIHPEATCVESARRAGALARAFKRKVSLPEGGAFLERLLMATVKDGMAKATAGQR